MHCSFTRDVGQSHSEGVSLLGNVGEDAVAATSRVAKDITLLAGAQKKGTKT